jgi:hypothetical protein
MTPVACLLGGGLAPAINGASCGENHAGQEGQVASIYEESLVLKFRCFELYNHLEAGNLDSNKVKDFDQLVVGIQCPAKVTNVHRQSRSCLRRFNPVRTLAFHRFVHNLVELSYNE